MRQLYCHCLLSAPLTPFKCVSNATCTYLLQGKVLGESWTSLVAQLPSVPMGDLSWSHESTMSSVCPPFPCSEEEPRLLVRSSSLHKACLPRKDRWTCMSYYFRTIYHILKQGPSIHWRVKAGFSFPSDDSYQQSCLHWERQEWGHVRKKSLSTAQRMTL